MKVFKYVTVVACAVLAGIVFADEDICSTPLSADQLADHWIACEGTGSSKDKAIDNAIKRGVSMVYGEVMSASDIAQSQMSSTAITTQDGESSSDVVHESMSSEMASKTAGFVREYKIISTEPAGNGEVKVHIHARIINQRAGIDGVILVARPDASVELKAALVKVGPKATVSGKEICSVAEKSLCGALSNSKHFRICTIGDIAAAAANNKLTDKLVATGMVPSSELLQAGQMLTADYILTTDIESISYSKKLGQDKKTKKFGQVQTLKMKLSFQLTNVRTGTSAGSDTAVLTLDNEAITEMLAADEDADLLRGVFMELVRPLRAWIKKNAK